MSTFPPLLVPRHPVRSALAETGRSSSLRRGAFVLATIAFLLVSSQSLAVSYHWSRVPISSPIAAVSAIAVAPGNPSVVYAGTANGLFASTDSGATWAKRSEKSDLSTLVVDPTSSSTVWAGSESGLWKSVDGGRNWSHLTVTPTGASGQFPAYAIAIDPIVPSTVFVGTSVGLYRTTDGGATWVGLTNGIPPLTNFFAVAIARSFRSTIYAGSAYFGGVFKSTDGGASWLRLDVWIPIPDTRALAVHPIDPSVAFRGDYSVGISKTTDGGAHWSLVDSTPGVVLFAIDPMSPDIVYAGSATDGLLKTTDGGATWTHIENGLAGVVVRAFAIDPRSPSHLYAGTAPDPFKTPPQYSGVFTSSDAGASWHPVSQTFGVATFSTVAVDPRIPSTILLDSLRSADGGTTWQAMDVSARFFVFDSRNPSTVFSGPPLRKSTDGGATWSPPTLLGLGSGVVGFAIDPSTSSTLYAVSNNGVFSKSVDAGVTWTSAVFTPPEVSSFAADPATPGTLFAGTGTGLLRSTDAGDTWSRVEGPWPAQDDFGPVAVRVIGADGVSGALYVSVSRVSGGVYRTSDGGTTWSRVPAFDATGLSALAADGSTGFLYAATGAGVLRSTDQGETFAAVDAGLPGAVTALSVDPLSSTVWAISDGLVYKATFQENLSCLADDATLCLNVSRFRVRAVWRTTLGSGDAHALPNTSDTGAFWFFSANNVEVVVKVVDGRSANGHFWVFGAALTNVEYTVEVIDTVTGAVWTHHNPPGRLASYADTAAF